MTERVEREFQGCMARLYGYALSLTSDRDSAQDLLQDCAVKALSARSVPTDAAALRAWFFRILRNAWIDRYRREQFEPMPADDEAFAPPDPATWRYDERLLDAITVRQGMSRLPPAHRDVIALVDLVGFPYAEVAEILGVPIGTVMSRLSRARQALLAVIGESNVRPLRARRRP
ncbi:MAG TPA: RNA polymerase sigma factor [Alphaproteobacteria bacterium]|nr:RNA polymerase sigma factor [Alphaproteobacteria bacterium]